VVRSDDLVIADSGLYDNTFNIVAAARFTQRSARPRIAQTMALLDATGRTFAWWVGPPSTPADLAARLVEAGLPYRSERPRCGLRCPKSRPRRRLQALRFGWWPAARN
jgi:hypothetical protein